MLESLSRTENATKPKQEPHRLVGPGKYPVCPAQGVPPPACLSAFNPYYIFLQPESQYFDSALSHRPRSLEESEANIVIVGRPCKKRRGGHCAAASALPLEPLRRPTPPLRRHSEEIDTQYLG